MISDPLPLAQKSVPRPPVKIWDAPTRLFHGAIILLVATSYLTIKYASGASIERLTNLHKLSGYAILSLLIFRLAWGVLGSETSRFTHFLRSPIKALQHLRHFPQREPDTQIGHNPAGGWMVLLFLAALLVQAVTGLFTFDDVPEGPLGGTVSEATAYWLTSIHRANFNIILALIALHVLAITAYAVIKRHNLIVPMITGRKRLPPTTRPPRMKSPWRALLLLLLAAGLVWLVATRG